MADVQRMKLAGMQENLKGVGVEDFEEMVVKRIEVAGMQVI